LRQFERRQSRLQPRATLAGGATGAADTGQTARGVESLKKSGESSLVVGDVVLDQAGTLEIAQAATSPHFTLAAKSVLSVGSLPATGDAEILYHRSSDDTLWLDTDGGGSWVQFGGDCLWQRNGVVLSPATAGDSVELIGTAVSGSVLNIKRDLASASTNSPVVVIDQENLNDDQPALTIYQDCPVAAVIVNASTGGAISASSSGSTIVAGTTSTDKDEYAIETDDHVKLGSRADFSERSAAASPRAANPSTGLGRLFCMDDSKFHFINASGKCYGWFDADGDTGIEVEQNADEDKIRLKTSGAERVVLDATQLKCTKKIRSDDKFNCNGSDGISASLPVITNCDFGSMMVKTKTLTFTGGILTAVSAESSWTSAPL
jgi:hypothetical protein